MKRLVICCDGTWNRPDSVNVTNIEKIARSVQTDLDSTGGIQQLVLYLSGVGDGYQIDRILGGAFGLGLFTNVLAGYRFLAQNYEPGDEVFVFGFSRGAYTARSIAGMIGRVGLLTRRALIAQKLPEAVARYQRRNPRSGRSGQADEEFRHDYCHPSVPIQFLGVFDTVGALGVPGSLSRRHRFHDVRLGDNVLCARQALAIDEPRMKFEPSLWDQSSARTEEDTRGSMARVKQVWFEGCHSDIGGGYAESGLSDTALLWMICEANRHGLVFDEELIRAHLDRGSSAIRHDPGSLLFRLVDLVVRIPIWLGLADGAAFEGRSRRLHRTDAAGVRVAESAADHFRADEGYRPAPMLSWQRDSRDFAEQVEPVIGLPEPSFDTIVARLAERGIALGEPIRRAPAPQVANMPQTRGPAESSDAPGAAEPATERL